MDKDQTREGNLDKESFYIPVPGYPGSPEYVEQMKNSNLGNFPWEKRFDSQDEYDYASNFSAPNFLINLFIEYLKPLHLNNVLLPFLGNGALPVALLTEGVIQEAICLSSKEVLIILSLFWNHELNIKYILGAWELNVLNMMHGQFDLTIAIPPIYTTPIWWQFNINNQPSDEYKDTETNLLVVESLCRLTKKGEGIFILPRSAIHQRNGFLLKMLDDLGFYINAILELPIGALKPRTSLPMIVFFISKVFTERAFVTYLDPDTPDIASLVNNIHNHKNCEKTDCGYTVNVKDFRSCKILSLLRELEGELGQSGLSLHFLGDLAIELNKGKNNSYMGGFTEKPNSIYFPATGYNEITTRFGEFKLSPINYYQINLDGNKAFSEYVANFLNSSLGLKIRKAYQEGSGVPRIPFDNIKNVPLLLPPVSKQILTVNLQNRIQTIKLALDSQEKTLQSQPQKLDDIRREIKRFDRQTDELFKDWINSLPFPLASILWRYMGEAEPDKKVDLLLHFFEAFAQFNVTYLTSAYYQDENIFNANKGKWFDPDSDFCHDKRATFGNWVIIGEMISKFTRSQISGKETRANVLDLFHTEKLKFIEVLVSKDIYKILHNAKNYRNEWIGHSGIRSANEERMRLALLEAELNSFRDIIKDYFDDFILLQPKTSEFNKGIFNNLVKNLMGSNSSFHESIIETKLPLDIDELYYLDKSDKYPLKLIRFFRMFPTPESEMNACYFYNRFEKQGVRWVSYYFDKQSEQRIEDEGLSEFFVQLEK